VQVENEMDVVLVISQPERLIQLPGEVDQGVILSFNLLSCCNLSLALLLNPTPSTHVLSSSLSCRFDLSNSFFVQPGLEQGVAGQGGSGW
jgi:hypothetical protein